MSDNSHSGLKAVIIFGAALLVGSAFYDGLKSPAPKAAEPPKTAQQLESDDYAAAVYVCEQWTEKNSKAAVSEFIHEYRLPRKKGSKLFTVRVDYRTKGAGWPMRTRCEVAHDAVGASYVLLSARSGLND